MPLTLHTSRLVIRPMRHEDAEGLWLRRNDPEVARYQNWSPPYPRERAENLVRDIISEGDPQVGSWWMGTIADRRTDAPLGDVALHLTWEGRSAEIGYTLARPQWGQGYALEAASALVEHLFVDRGVTRVFGTLHPDNTASAMVLERLGMLFEGHTRSSYWVGDVVSDDWIYGMTREDWEAWRDRPRTPPADVRLVEVSADNLRPVLALRTHHTQEAMVAPVVRSLAQAQVPPIRDDGTAVVPWYRAIAADGGIVGFVMVSLPAPTRPEAYLWRLLIDRMHQRRGIAGRALDLVEAEMRDRGAVAMRVSYVEGRGAPGPFYAGRGYVPTGEVHGDETEARKTWGTA
jgi:RimJ/RimL family protein N-acetyltransferase